MTDDEQANKCLEKHGFSRCSTIVVKCECDGCTGNLQFDGTNAIETLSFMMCSVCGCTYAVNARRVPERIL